MVLALFSATSFYVTATALGWDKGTGEWLRSLTGDSPQQLWQCPSRVWDSKLFLWTAKAFYYSKYVEYLDTAWLVLKGKKASPLRVPLPPRQDVALSPPSASFHRHRRRRSPSCRASTTLARRGTCTWAFG